MNILVQTLPGVAITYQGEELVLPNWPISWEETVDPAACHENRENYYQKSRDPSRTPFPWDSSKNAGFSSGNKTWLPINGDYVSQNVEAQLAAANSHLKIFKKLVKLRKETVMREGDYAGVLTNSDQVYTFKRQKNNDLVIVVLNFGKNQETINLKSAFPFLPDKMKIVTSSLNSGMKDE